MNLFLRPLEDVNDVTWSIVWCLVILLAGVSYYIVYILLMAFDELNHDNNQSEGRRSGSADSITDTQN